MIDLYNDDCLEVMNYLIEKDVKVDSIITDIPYYQVVNDDWDNQWKCESDYLAWVERCVECCSKLLKDNGSILLFTGRQHNRKVCNILDNYFEEKRTIIWARKRSFNTTRGNALTSGYEPICYYTKGTPVFNNLKIKVDSKRKEYKSGTLKNGVSLSDVWSDISALPHNSKEKVAHPTQKPLKLIERCILMTTNEGDTVLDFTMGSGTTCIACIKTNRNFIGVEINTDYFTIVTERIKNIAVKGKSADD
jgi:site-specific DNA-methyltransferase (adenine-specific)